MSRGDWLLLRRNGWRRTHRGRFHSNGWWYRDGWNWAPKEDALVLSRAWEQERRAEATAAAALTRQMVGELEDELTAARSLLREQEAALAATPTQHEETP